MVRRDDGGGARRCAAIALAAALSWVPGSASADSTEVTDPRDEALRVDPVQAVHGHHESLSGVLVHQVSMAEPWKDGDLLGAVYDVWLPDGDKTPDRYVTIGYNPDGSLYALVTDYKGRPRGYGNAWMPDDRTIRVDLPEALFRADLTKYRWRLTVSMECEPQHDPCFPARDVVPDDGRVVHRL